MAEQGKFSGHFRGVTEGREKEIVRISASCDPEIKENSPSGCLRAAKVAKTTPAEESKLFPEKFA
jgi:hypothetical protein